VAESTLNAEAVAKSLHAAFCRDVPPRELLQQAATKIRAAGGPYTSVFIYMLDDSGDTLVLEASDGRPTDLTRIPVGDGICGKAVAEKRDINVPDVSSSPEYLACSLETRSELVVLIRRHEEILGEIDIDSDVPDGFDDAEVASVKRVADALAALL
jgi:L-methionine (R)-S-oxide reductase